MRSRSSSVSPVARSRAACNYSLKAMLLVSKLMVLRRLTRAATMRTRARPRRTRLLEPAEEVGAHRPHLEGCAACPRRMARARNRSRLLCPARRRRSPLPTDCRNRRQLGELVTRVAQQRTARRTRNPRRVFSSHAAGPRSFVVIALPRAGRPARSGSSWHRCGVRVARRRGRPTPRCTPILPAPTARSRPRSFHDGDASWLWLTGRRLPPDRGRDVSTLHIAVARLR